MTRDEEIIRAAREYNDSITLSNPSNVLHFEAGAKWADNNPDLSSLWHDASEEPKDDLGKDDSVIIYQDKYGNCWFTTKREIVILHINWECFATVNVRYWIYISDLLPKQFGKNEQLKGGEK